MFESLGKNPNWSTIECFFFHFLICGSVRFLIHANFVTVRVNLEIAGFGSNEVFLSNTEN